MQQHRLGLVICLMADGHQGLLAVRRHLAGCRPPARRSARRGSRFEATGLLAQPVGVEPGCVKSKPQVSGQLGNERGIGGGFSARRP